MANPTSIGCLIYLSIIVTSCWAFPCQNGDCYSFEELPISKDYAEFLSEEKYNMPPCTKEYSYNYPLLSDKTCQLYFQCREGKFTVQSCSPHWYNLGYYFDRDTEKCIWSPFKPPNCTEIPPTPSTIEPSVSTTPAPTSEPPQPTSLIMNIITTLATLGELGYLTSVGNSWPDENPPKCQHGNETIASEKTCSFYWQCINGTAVMEECGILRKFNPKHSSCDLAWPFFPIDCRSGTPTPTGSPPTKASTAKPTAKPNSAFGQTGPSSTLFNLCLTIAIASFFVKSS